MAKSLRWLLFLIFINGACNKCYASADPCESISAPTPVSTLLGKSYQGWRIENLSDLDSANQAAWLGRVRILAPACRTDQKGLSVSRILRDCKRPLAVNCS